MTLIQTVRAAWPARQAEALQALDLFRSWCIQPPPRIPGMDTVLRLAVRIDQGTTVTEAAAREYSYRWHLFAGAFVSHAESRSRTHPIGAVFPAPHLLGM